ncbi:MAG: YceI family protein, partial [Bacteroidetes bacterium]|nr:YceI family protein [Bacteroidota bacterium]
MKRIFLFLIAVVIWKAGFAQYKPADQGSSVKFTIQNFGFDVNGSFTGLHGAIDFDPQKPENARFDVDIDASSINTDNTLRDGHLRGASYFDVKNHPRIRLESIKVEADSQPGSYKLLGKLTIKNTTKNIFVPFTATATPDGYQFNGSFKINRKDFSV